MEYKLKSSIQESARLVIGMSEPADHGDLYISVRENWTTAALMELTLSEAKQLRAALDEAIHYLERDTAANAPTSDRADERGEGE